MCIHIFKNTLVLIQKNRLRTWLVCHSHFVLLVLILLIVSCFLLLQPVLALLIHNSVGKPHKAPPLLKLPGPAAISPLKPALKETLIIGNLFSEDQIRIWLEIRSCQNAADLDELRLYRLQVMLHMNLSVPIGRIPDCQERRI